MKEQWRSSQQSEQEPPAAQQEISRKETVCGECGRPYSRARKKKLGKRALKMDAEEAPKVPKRRFETPEEMVRDFSQRNPERAAQIRNRFSPEWDLGERERIGDDWNLPTIDDMLWETYRKNRLNDHPS